MATRRETRFQNTYLGRKINETITAMLNDMTQTTDNSTTEDVSLAEILDRLTIRVNNSIETVEKTVEKVEAIASGDITVTGSSAVKFYPSINKFPSGSDAKAEVLCINTSDYTMWCWNPTASAYAPVKFQFSIGDLTTEDINNLIKVINGGTATTVL